MNNNLPADEVIDTFKNVVFVGFKYPIITIYFNTSDYPNKYVARLFDLHNPQPYAVIGTDLESIRKCIPNGFTLIPRHPKDEKTIVEAWIM